MKDLLLVVDMQNVYREGAAWGCPGTAGTLRNLRLLLASGKPAEVIFTRFDAPEKPVGTWRDYNQAYAEINEDVMLNEMMAELREYTEKYPVYGKSAYSSYAVREIREAVQRADRVLLCGVVAECCILATLLSLIDAGVKVLYVKDAIAGQTAKWEETVEKIAASFSDIHVEVVTAGDYVRG